MHNVVVHKSKISLLKGESLQDYTNKVSSAGKTYLSGQISGEDIDIYMIECYSDTAIFDVYQYDKKIDWENRTSYHAITYKRNTNGDIEITSSKEVVRVTSFVPKNADIVINKSTYFGNKISTWKSLWDGVL